MLVTFGATFFGVIASFLLWFWGQWLIRRKRDKKALRAMMREIIEEIGLNKALLETAPKAISKILNKGDIPMYLSLRMNFAVYNYIVQSGEIRLIKDINNVNLKVI